MDVRRACQREAAFVAGVSSFNHLVNEYDLAAARSDVAARLDAFTSSIDQA